MHDLTPEGRRAIADLARRHGFSTDAVMALLRPLAANGGTMAQFSHPELGGMGQWSAGGMVMIGDMFNNGLKARVDSICNDLVHLLQDRSAFAPPPASRQSPSSQSQHQGSGSPGVSCFASDPGSGSWWPDDLGQPASTGAQNDMRYACFPDTRRLAIRSNGVVTVYDTGAHRITGFSQQQGGGQSLTFTSQIGLVRVSDLPVISGKFHGQQSGGEQSNGGDQPSGEQRANDQSFWRGSHEPVYQQAGYAPSPAQPSKQLPAGQDHLATLERLAELRDRGILTDDEFAAKKADLLSRL